MTDRTTIPIEKETRRKLKVEKEIRECRSYDELLNEYVDTFGFMRNRSE
jgi:hypothetical protein